MKLFLRMVTMSLFGKLFLGLGRHSSILMYHSVSLNNKFFTVTPKKFEKQIRYIHKKGYKVIFLSEMIRKIKNRESISGMVSITFDDGYQDNYLNAFPILKKYNLPATFFLIAGQIDQEGFLSKEQIKYMYKEGIAEFMPHTVNHPDLRMISFEESLLEINNSKVLIEDILGIQSNVFAYPKGRYTEKILDYVKCGGEIDAAVTVEGGLVSLEDDIFLLKRNAVDSKTNFLVFKTLLNRGVLYYEKLKNKLFIFDFIKQSMSGKTLARILFNEKVSKYSPRFYGKVLDLAGGLNPSYLKYLPGDIKYIPTDLKQVDEVVGVDLNKKLPFEDNSFDVVLLFNSIYILEDINSTLNEIKRVLNKGGTLYLSSPFVFNEAKEPHDYIRLTSEGLVKTLSGSGFDDFIIEKIGERFSSAASMFHSFYIFNIVRLFIYSVCNILDNFIPTNIIKNHPMPMSYFCIVKNNKIIK